MRSWLDGELDAAVVACPARAHHVALEVIFHPVAGEHILPLGQPGAAAHDDLGAGDIVFDPRADALDFRLVRRRFVAQGRRGAGRFHPLEIVVLNVNGHSVGGQPHRTLGDHHVAFVDADPGFLIQLATAGLKLNRLGAVFRQGDGQ